MKPFKGCVNENCSAYKKIHYRRDDHYCRKCGHPLYSVCADCWTVLGEDDTQRICASCQAKRTQRNAERVDNITWGEDIQPVIDGQYVLINRSTQRAVEITQGNTAEGTNVKTGKFDASKAYQRWYVRPVSSRIGGDFSYFCITSPINSTSGIGRWRTAGISPSMVPVMAAISNGHWNMPGMDGFISAVAIVPCIWKRERKLSMCSKVRKREVMMNGCNGV